jgi:Type II site-specific deoxyribonuclease
MDDELLGRELSNLTPSQRMWVRAVVSQFKLPHSFYRNPKSDWITDEVLERLGDALRIHHAFSRQPLTKDRFEFAFESALNLSGIRSALVWSRTNRGHDITIAGVPVCLKTEAAAQIKLNSIHVSKWMELGKGEWSLPLLLKHFLEHLRSYERIFTLRCLKAGPVQVHYELVEIPKSLLLEAKNCQLQVMENSRQSPKPGYGYVLDSSGEQKFSLYFDGGTERKLQIKYLHKSNCVVHASWTFDSKSLGTVDELSPL